MQIQCEILLLVAFAIDVCICQTEAVNGTVSSRREILEKQAMKAYENACYGLQELSNWMSVVFKMKSVWTSSTIHQLKQNSGNHAETEQRKIPSLPPRPKTAELGCSLQNAQVTLHTYAHLQRQLLYLKTILGRNMVKSSTVKLTVANSSIRERIKMLDVFNETFNDIFTKLRSNTQELISQNPNARNFNDGGFLQFLQIPTNIFQAKQGENGNSGSVQPRSKGFFQYLGKTLDNIVFPRADATQKNGEIRNTKDSFEQSLGTTTEGGPKEMTSKNEGVEVEQSS